MVPTKPTAIPTAIPTVATHVQPELRGKTEGEAPPVPKLDELPAEIITHISNNLAPRDRGPLLTSNRTLNAILREQFTAFRLGADELSKIDISRYPNLNRLKITGLLTPEDLAKITRAPRLAHLDLSGTQAEGNVPHQIALMSRLKTLDLTDCNWVSASTLEHLSRLEQLETLALSGNDWFANEHLDRLNSSGQIKSLSLGGCHHLTDEGVKRISHFTTLKHLDLQGCRAITDKSINHLAALPALDSINLMYCQQLGAAQWNLIANRKNWTQIAISGFDWLRDTHLENLRDYEHLTALTLRHCRGLTDLSMTALSHLTGLVRLDLMGMRQATNQGVIRLASLKKLSHLNLLWCPNVTRNGLETLQSKLLQLNDLRV